MHWCRSYKCSKVGCPDSAPYLYLAVNCMLLDASKLTSGNVVAMVIGLLLWAASFCLLIIGAVLLTKKFIKRSK